MKQETELLIKNRLDAIYSLVDQIILELENTNGLKICYPIGPSQQEVEDALLEFAESKIASNNL